MPVSSLEHSTGRTGSCRWVPSGRWKGRASLLLIRRCAAWPLGRRVLLSNADLGSSSPAAPVRIRFPETFAFISTDRQFRQRVTLPLYKVLLPLKEKSKRGKVT